jgi:NhaA family Na+:H+ antiporter
MRQSEPLPPLPTAPIVRILRPFQAFAENEAAGGGLLLICTLGALVWANSPWSPLYEALWHTDLTVSLAGKSLSHDLHHWVNDLLMAVFFFVVGLEIKRELLVGELSSLRHAALPIAGALGGVIVPAIFYAVLNPRGPSSAGWGIPMATDIAFALGVMTLLGDRIPSGLKIFLTALAIVDDIAAVVVIALFYTDHIAWEQLGAAAICLALLILLGLLGARQPLIFAIGGLILWIFVLNSGVHATIVGVALAMAVPSRTPLNFGDFLVRSRAVLNHAEREVDATGMLLTSEDQQAALQGLEDACEKVQPPLHRLEHALHPWVTFFIMPVFALANAGVVLHGNLTELATHTVTLGVFTGLLFGKPVGILLASWAAVRLNIASLPAGVRWSHIHGAGWLGGIGFTMSLFVATLAFADDAAMLTMAKVGVLAASACAAFVGSTALVRSAKTS